MSAICFCTTPKVDLPHYSYILINPKKLGTELNGVACSRLGNMLYLDILKGEVVNEDTGTLPGDWRYCSVYEETNEVYKRVVSNSIKRHLLF